MRERFVRSMVCCTIAVSVIGAGSVVAAAGVGASVSATTNPAASIPKVPDFTNSSCTFPGFDDSSGCQLAVLQAIDHARAAEGVGAMVLPSNYGSLTRAQQVFVLINIERVDRQLPPITGLVAALNTASLAGAQAIDDPVLPAGYPTNHYGTISAGGETTALGTLYDWMYFDGLRGNNPECTSSTAPKCWIHRVAILSHYDNDPSSMGTAVTTAPYQGMTLAAYAALLAGNNTGAAASYTFTWAQEAPYLKPPPVVRGMTPTSGPAAGGSTVTVTGANLGSVTELDFGSAGPATSLHASADGASLTAVTPTSASVGAVDVVAKYAGGSTAVGPFTYTSSAPSAPRSVVASAPVAGATTVSWQAPNTTGGSPITGYTVTPYLNGKVAQAAQSVAGSALTDPVTGLVNGESYTFSVVATNAIGSGPAARSAMILPPFVSPTAFVQRQHLDLAGVAVPAAELLTELAAIDGGAKPAAYVAALRRSTDATGNVDTVARLYFAYFLRVPDAGGLAHWINKRRAGTVLIKISASFATSHEFVTRYGNLSNLAFVNLVYQNVLGRPGDAAGVDHWTRQLDTHAKSRGQVMLNFSESSEYKTKEEPSVDVAVTWIDLLGARPDQASFDQHVGLLASTEISLTDLAAELLADPRYAARVG